ncbi:MAG: hypothetical protein EZS28_039149 [Streblomastix strix]|uniref:Uncharacterized protein n=1 Tax=Streblomastix strix TaxID=222440 RepID=A0A5J4U6H6_9EUKA|nr:MAG: hypothetical protein EZS28_039149 [Streblomastix strix]
METPEEVMQNQSFNSIHLSGMGMVNLEYGSENAKKSETLNEIQAQRVDLCCSQSSDCQSQGPSISDRRFELSQVLIHRSIAYPQLSESTFDASSEKSRIELFTSVEQENLGQSLHLVTQNHREQSNEFTGPKSNSNDDNGRSRDRMGCYATINQFEFNGCRLLEGKMASDGQQLARDGSSPPCFEILPDGPNKRRSTSVTTPDRQLDSGIFVKKMESNSCVTTSSENHFSTPNITQDQTENNSYPGIGEQGCRFAESSSVERGLQNQSISTDINNEYTKLFPRNRSLRNTNKQTVSKILFAVKGPTRNRKKGSIQHQLFQSKPSDSSANRANPENLEENEDGALDRLVSNA